MKSSALRIGVLALGIFLFNWQPAIAGCGQKCSWGAICERDTTDPGLGCFQEDVTCWEYICDLSVTPDQQLARKMAAAAQSGDTKTVVLLAATVGQPFRLYSEGKLVYDGLPTGATRADRLAACGSAAPAPAESAAETPETAKKADDAP